MCTKFIVKTDVAVEKAKSRALSLHHRMQKNRAAEMMEVAVVVGVVIALIAVFQQLQKAVGDKISDAATKVSGSGKTKG